MKTIQTLIILASAALWLSGCGGPQSHAGDDDAVRDAVETLRAAMVSAEKDALETIAADTLLYIHSSGKIQNKAEFMQTFLDKDSVFVTLEFSDIVVRVTRDTAIVNHKLAGQTADKGKPPGNANLGSTLVFQKQNGAWKLLARQAYKL